MSEQKDIPMETTYEYKFVRLGEYRRWSGLQGPAAVVSGPVGDAGAVWGQ
jgi:hypothetical protein